MYLLDANAFAEERNADGWLVAYAMKFPGTVIVTMEDFNAAKQSKVPIPDIDRVWRGVDYPIRYAAPS
ncbi:MAG TPA: DUF4411 family protein [Terrimicrobium sp.]